jgi:23S rRNA (adenine2503-C2)-methyltransferase
MTDKKTMLDIRQLSDEELANVMEALGQPSFRTKQLHQWLWQKGASGFSEMTNLSTSLREQLSDAYSFNSIVPDAIQNSVDGTIKSRWKLFDGKMIESVLIPVVDENRFTVCVSSQVGCSLNCAFCATGKLGYSRNLEVYEIFEQFHLVNQQCESTFFHPLTNIVFMGMGEPLLNYKNVLKAIEKITSPEGYGWSPRRITLSTVGIAKMIHKLAEDDVKFNLALSLHAADDEKRNKIMPINQSNKLEILMDALEDFYLKTKGKISFEYIAFNGFNDTFKDADNLIRLCKRFPVKVNIIEYNPVEGVEFSKSSDDQIDKFARYLTDHNVLATVRRSRGKDIDAACGQLANKASLS